MDNKFDRHNNRGGDNRYSNSTENHHHHTSNSRHSRSSGEAPFNHQRPENYRGGGGNSPNFHGGDAREHQRRFDGPAPSGGEIGGRGGGLRPIGDGIGGFPAAFGGGSWGGFRPMGRGDGGFGGGFRPIGGGFDGEGFIPMSGGGGEDGGGLNNYRASAGAGAPPSLSGHKRGHFSSARERSPDRFAGAGFAKLFVGSVPRTATEEDIRPLFAKHGRVLEVALIKDKRTGQQQGCCFIKYASSEEAGNAIRGLHNQYTLPGALGPLQVRFADGERARLGENEYKLFVGSMNKQATEKEIEEIFSAYGRVDDVYLMRDEMKQSRGCGFVKFPQREMAQAAIDTLNGTYTMRGCDQPLTVRFAEPKRPRPGDQRGEPVGGPGFGPRFSSNGIRPGADFPEPIRGQIPPNSWPPVSSQNMVPPSQGPNGVRPSQGPTGVPPSQPDGLQLNLNPQIPSFGSKVSPIQRPIQSPQPVPSPYNQAPPPRQLPHVVPSQQQPPAQQLHQSPSDLAQMLSQQKQTLQATFQSSQQAFNQLQMQLQQLQPANHNLTPHQGQQGSNQQTPWAGDVAHSTSSTAPVSCNWTEHTSPDGYKYYYNSTTGESKWEKPEELTPQPKAAPILQPPQMQVQWQQPSQSSSVNYKQEFGYGQIPAGSGQVNDPARFQQASQEWAWKNKPSGT